MTDLVDQVAESYPVNLDNMVEEMKAPMATRMPEASKRNQAALTALLSDDPSQLVQNYQAIQREADEGIDFTRKSILRKAQQKQSISDQQGMMGILSDANIDIETKRAALANLNSEFNMSTPALVISGAAQEPSKGESREAESVRISGAEQWNIIHGAKEEKQQLINRAYALASPTAASVAGQVLEKDLAPFAINKAGFGILNDVLKLLGKKEAPMLTAAMPGTSIQQIRERLEAMPPADQKEAVKKIADLVQNTPRIVYTKDSQYIKAQILEQLIGGQEYGTAAKWIDNTLGVLDVFGVWGLAGKGIKKLSSKFIKSEAQVAKDIDLRAPTSDIAPMSPMKQVEDVNPGKAQAMYATIAKSEGDEAAQALTGTTRDKALAEPMLPQVLTRQGNVESKVVNPDAELLEEITNTSARRFTDAERDRIVTKFQNDVNSIQSIVPHDNMIAAGVVGDRKVLRATFGTPEGGFLNAEEAIAQTKFALARFGITEKEITLLKKEGDEYIPTTLAETKGVEGNYLTQVESNSPIRTSELDDGFDALDVKRNFFDRMPWFRFEKAGTPAAHAMPAATMLHKTITGPASTAVNKSVRLEKQLLKMHDQFAKDIRAFPAERRHSILEYIQQANYHGFEEDAATLLGRGFTKEEVGALQQFRKNWDTHYWLENRDANITLANQGFGVLETKAGDRYFAKAVGRSPFYKPVEVLDPTTNTVRVIDKLEREALYDAGGTLGKLRSPVDINGTYVEHVFIRNSPDEYLRAMHENDQVLNYRKGYYQVEYKNGRQFIYEKIMVDGVERQRVREIAGSTEEALLAAKRLARQEGKPESAFGTRPDRNEMNVGQDAYWETGQQHGRLAQRRRGERLEADNIPVGTMDSRYIMNPMEAATRASASIARRVSMRDLLETAKARAMSQYKAFFPSDGMGGVKWTNDSNDLRPTGSPYDAELANARSTVHHLNYLESGYQNAVDNGFKMLMNTIANVLKGSPSAEKTFMWLGDMKPMSTGKSGVMHAYLSGAPVRQFLIQSHQTVRLLGYNPTYLFGPMTRDVAMMGKAKLLGVGSLTAEQKALHDVVIKSGALDAVDRHNLVRGLVVDMETSATRGVKIAGNIASIPRKVGFDSGEKSSKMVHIMAVFDKFKKDGKNVLDPNVRDEILEVADAMTYGMTHAGDMPYNQNALGLLFQFAQAPHKALTTVFDRRIPVNNRLVMAGADLLLFGVPGALLIEQMVGKNMLPEDSKNREATVNGLVSIAYNKALSHLAGKDVNVNFESLSPFGIDGFSKLLHGVVAGNFAEAFKNAPAYSLYFKDGGKIPEALQRSLRYTGFIDETEGMTPEDAISVLKGWAEVFSGYNHGVRAKLIMEMGKIPNKSGDGILMEDASFAYAAMQMFGFTSKLEAAEYAAMHEQSKFDKSWKDANEAQYKEYSRRLTRGYEMSTGSPEYFEKMMGVFQLQYKGDYEKLNWFHQRLAKDMVENQDTIMKKMLKHGNMPTEETFDSAQQDLANIGDERYKQAFQMKRDMLESIKKQMEE